MIPIDKHEYDLFSCFLFQVYYKAVPWYYQPQALPAELQ